MVSKTYQKGSYNAISSYAKVDDLSDWSDDAGSPATITKTNYDDGTYNLDCFAFTGAGSVNYTPSRTNLNIDLDVQDLIFEAWWNSSNMISNAGTSGMCHIRFDFNYAGGDRLWFGHYTWSAKSGSPLVRFIRNSETGFSASGVTLANNEWFQFKLKATSTHIYGYINGVEQYSGTHSMSDKTLEKIGFICDWGFQSTERLGPWGIVGVNGYEEGDYSNEEWQHKAGLFNNNYALEINGVSVNRISNINGV